MTSIEKKKWWKIRWFADDDTPEERRFLTKMDMLVIPYLFVTYWVKNLDQNNLNNAYVAGLKEDLGFYGNELVELQTMYIVGAVVGQVPFLFLFTYIPMHWLLPGLDITWGIFTLVQYRAKSFAELAAYRFLVGFFEASYFPAVHYVLGSWYKRHEISRRGGIWYLGVPVGNLTAGLVQSGITLRLEGVNDLAGWRWMFIICAIITIPIGFIGFFVVPGTMEQPNRWLFSEKDIEISRKRLTRSGHAIQGKFKLRHMKETFTSFYFYVAVLVDVLFWNCGTNSGAFLLWLKSLGRYSSAKVNQYGTLPSGLGIFYTLFINFSSDLLWGPAWGITAAATMDAIAMLILAIWEVPESAKWYAYCTSSFSYALSSSLYGWINNILRDSPGTRSFTLVFINIIAQSSTAWLGILTYPTVQAPRYKRGFAYSFACAVALIIFTHVLDSIFRQRRQREAQKAVEASDEVFSEPTIVDSSTDEPTKAGPHTTVTSQSAER